MRASVERLEREVVDIEGSLHPLRRSKRSS
jgi:hypothetical protein